MLEDGDLLHVDPRGRTHVFNVLSLTTNTLARTNISDLEVKRVGRKIEAEIESVMKVSGAQWQWSVGMARSGVCERNALRCRLCGIL